MVNDNYNTLINKLKELKEFDSSIFNVRLVTKSSIPNEVLHQNINQVSIILPDLINCEFKEKDGEIVFKNDEKQLEKQKMLGIHQNKEFTLAWGMQTNIDFEEETKKFLLILNKHFQIYPVNVSYIEIKLLLQILYEVDHYELFKNTYYNSTLDSLFDRNSILSNDINLLGTIGNDLRASIIIASIQGSDEILDKKYENKEIRFRGGVASIKILPSPELSTQAMELFEKGLNYLYDKFIPIVINPVLALIKKSN